jgi:hypothetical protein
MMAEGIRDINIMKCCNTSIIQLAVSAYGNSTSTRNGRAGKIMYNRDRVGMSGDLFQLCVLLQVLRGLCNLRQLCKKLHQGGKGGKDAIELKKKQGIREGGNDIKIRLEKYMGRNG